MLRFLNPKKIMFLTVLLVALSYGSVAHASTYSNSLFSFHSPNGWANVGSKSYFSDQILALGGSTINNAPGDMVVQKLSSHPSISKYNAKAIAYRENKSKNINAIYSRTTLLNESPAFQLSLVFRGNRGYGVEDVVDFKKTIYLITVVSPSLGASRVFAREIFSSWHWSLKK
jgi:hypothetical protein